MKNFLAIVLLFATTSLFLGLGCYSFKGISIPSEIQTFTVLLFENNAPNSLATLQQTFTERLKRKILNESRLNHVPANGDVEFSGAITRYQIVTVTPQPGVTSALNRLEIDVRVTYTHPTDEKASWSNTFARFAEFDQSLNFASVQDRLIDEINEQLVEDIFNKAFTNW